MRQTVQDQGQQQQMTAQPGGANLSDSEKKVNWQKQQQDMFNQKQSGQPQGIYLYRVEIALFMGHFLLLANFEL